MFRKLSSIAIAVGLISFSCSDETPYDPPQVFQISFSDSLNIVAGADSTHVLLIQHPYVYQGYIQPIPFDTNNYNTFVDTVRIRVDFLYVGPSANPNRHPYYAIRQSRDSLILEFSLAAPWKGSTSGQSLTDTPPPAYNMITHAHISKSSGHYISFESRLVP